MRHMVRRRRRQKLTPRQEKLDRAVRASGQWLSVLLHGWGEQLSHAFDGKDAIRILDSLNETIRAAANEEIRLTRLFENSFMRKRKGKP